MNLVIIAALFGFVLGLGVGVALCVLATCRLREKWRCRAEDAEALFEGYRSMSRELRVVK
jgi:hypothetical protein